MKSLLKTPADSPDGKEYVIGYDIITGMKG